MREHGTLHVSDAGRAKRIPNHGFCQWPTHLLSVPLRQQGELIGGLFARRMEVRAFTPAQIKLLETFADQAVIAIENVRLFQELGSATNSSSGASDCNEPRCSALSAARRQTCSRCSTQL